MRFIKNLKLNNKKTFILSVIFLIGVGFFWNINYVHATDIFGFEDFLTKGVYFLVGGILGIVVSLVGAINLMVVSAIISISSYNNFINEGSIVMAWSIIRDFCNMFFILILLVIAFATILRIESYNMKKWLPKLLLMAVLINFSRTIAGLIIDFSQVFMLTFVSAISSTGGDYMNALGVDLFFDFAKKKVSESKTGTADLPQLITALFLGTLFLIIAVVVLMVVLFALIIRMVMLWIYVVLSPLAFLLASFPGGQKYSSRWWDEFIKNVITGPILMFFVWLALVSANSFNNSSLVKNGVYGPGGSFGVSEIMDPKIFIQFTVAIGMLIGGLIITSQAGGAVGGLASKGQSMISKNVKGFAGRVTGYDYAKRTGQGYMAMRQSNRNEKIRLSSDKLAYTVGVAKQATLGRVGGLGTAIKNKTWNYVGKNKADELRERAKQDELRLEEIKHGMSSLKAGESFTDTKGNSYEKINDNSWINKSNGTTETIGLHENIIKANKNKAKEAEDRQEMWNKRLKYGLGGGGALLGGFLTGGTGLVGLASGAAGAALGYGAGKRGLPKLTSAVADAGKEDLSLASNFRVKQVSDAREKMKNQDLESVKATMDDSTKDVFTRVAAAMEAISRGALSTEEAKEKRDFIQEKMGGLDRKGAWNDKRLGYQVDSLLEQHNPGATNRFEKAYGDTSMLKNKHGYTDEEVKSVRTQAQREIEGSYATGALTMEKTDTQSLLVSMGQLVLALKTGNFVKQFKAITNEAKKTQIIEKLKEVNTPESKEKLAHITDVKTAYGSDTAGAINFVGGLNVKQLMEIIEDSDGKKLQAVKDVVNNVNDLSINVQNVIKAESPSGKTIKKIFKV